MTNSKTQGTLKLQIPKEFLNAVVLRFEIGSLFEGWFLRFGISPQSESVLDITLIIPQYQQSERTRECVASVRRHEAAAWPIVVIDDGSAPAHRALLREDDPQTRFVSVRHRGLTAAWNIGVRLAETELVVLVNNDVRWSGPVVDGLAQPLRDKTALVTGVAWREERWWPSRWKEALPPRPLLAGWCWAFRRQTWLELGGFDESLELYFSDTDFQLRVLRESQGSSAKCQGFNRNAACLALGTWPLALGSQPFAPLHHAAHGTTKQLPDRREQWERDRRRFQEKWS